MKTFKEKLHIGLKKEIKIKNEISLMQEFDVVHALSARSAHHIMSSCPKEMRAKWRKNAFHMNSWKELVR